MPVTYTVTPLGTQWTLDEASDGRITGKTVWQIKASEPSTPAAARNAAGTLQRGDSPPGDTGFPCVSRSCKVKDDTRTLFVLECSHDSQGFTSPLDEAAKISVSSESYEESYFKDKSSTPKYAVHTNKRPFDELPKRDRSIKVISWEKNVAASATDATYDPLRDTVNASSLTIDGVTYAAGKVRVFDLALSEVKGDGESGTYRTISAKLKVHPDGWDQKFESRGTVDINGKRKQVAADASPNDEPWPLNSSGAFTSAMSDAGAEIVLTPYAAADHSIFAT